MTEQQSELFGVFLPMFLQEMSDQLKNIYDNLDLIKQNPTDELLIDSLFRILHTIKGNSGLCELKNFSALTHSIEDVVALLRDNVVSYSENWFQLVLDGINLLKDAITHIKEDFYYDETFEFEEYTISINKFINYNKTLAQKKSFNIDEKILLDEDEVNNYFLQYLTYYCYKAKIIIKDDQKDFADLKMAVFLNLFMSYKINILKTFPSYDILGTVKYINDLYKNELIIFFEQNPESKKIFEKVCKKNKSSIKNYSLEKININDLLVERRKRVKTDNIKFQIAIISINKKLYAVICNKIIKIAPPENINFLNYNSYNLGFIRYLDKAVPVISLNKNQTDKILIFDTVSGIIGIFIDEIVSAKKSNFYDLKLNPEIKTYIYNYNGENINVLFIDDLKHL
jgi:HPt (histidine-containing phosphotransfer) domain-containing protein